MPNYSSFTVLNGIMTYKKKITGKWFSHTAKNTKFYIIKYIQWSEGGRRNFSVAQPYFASCLFFSSSGAAFYEWKLKILHKSFTLFQISQCFHFFKAHFIEEELLFKGRRQWEGRWGEGGCGNYNPSSEKSSSWYNKWTRQLSTWIWSVKWTTECCISEWEKTEKGRVIHHSVCCRKTCICFWGMLWTFHSPWTVTDIRSLPSSFTPSSLKQLSQPKVCL